MKDNKKQRGSVLIFALWVLVLLGIFAAQIGLRVRQRVTFLSRVETRSNLHFMAKAGIDKGIAALLKDIDRHKGEYTSYGKRYRHNNPEMFKHQKIGQGFFDVSFKTFDEFTQTQNEYFGISDEESRVNLNFADQETLIRLFARILPVDEESARTLVGAIIEWREFGRTTLEGFNSEDYYKSLAYPYEPKGFEFERLDELLLVRGITDHFYEMLLPYVTIYGDGKVNINTASLPVLTALGLSDQAAELLLSVRRGEDERPFTTDDYVFQKSYDVASEVQNFRILSKDDFLIIDGLNRAEKIKTNSTFYRIESEAYFSPKDEIRRILAVYNTTENMFDYWYEK